MIIRPADSLLAGEYELDEFSYSRVDKTQAYPNTPILLTIQANGSFQVTNLPDMVFSTAGSPVKRKLLNAIGSWSIPADTPISKNNGFVPFNGRIIFRFYPNDLFHIPITLNNQLTLRYSQPAILIPFGPGGTYQRLLFVKKITH